MATDRSMVEAFDIAPLPEPTPTPPAAERRTLRRVATVGVALLLPLGAVAVLTSSDGGVELEDLAAAADRTEAVDSVRFEMSMSISAEGEDLAFPLATGEQADGDSHLVMDLGAMQEATGTSPFGDDVAMEIYTVDGVLYLRAPMFATLADLGGAVPPALAPLAELGDRWGVADAAATGATPEEVAAATGSNGLDMATGLDLMRGAADDLEETGPGEVRGVPVTEFEGSITFDDLFDAQGGDLSMLDGLFPADVEGIDTDAILDAMSTVELDLEVAVDDDGLVRRVAFGFDESFFGAVFEEMGLPGGGEVPDLEMQMAIELYDLGDDSISIEAPVVEDPVDLTPWALEMAERAG